MQSPFEEIRRQIHDIRSFLGPFDIKMASLDHRIAEMRVWLDERFSEYESKLMGTSFKLEDQVAKLGDLMDRVNWIEMSLNVPPRPTLKSPPLPPEQPRA